MRSFAYRKNSNSILGKFMFRINSWDLNCNSFDFHNKMIEYNILAKVLYLQITMNFWILYKLLYELLKIAHTNILNAHCNDDKLN